MTVTLHVPRVGDVVRIDEDWTFSLYSEYRNDSMLQNLGFSKSRWAMNPRGRPVTLSKDTYLKVNRVYIRQGNSAKDNNDYDSLTFTILHSLDTRLQEPKFTTSVPGIGKCVRFWAKVDDVNQMQVTWDPKLPQVLIDAAAQKKVRGRGKLTLKNKYDAVVGDVLFSKRGVHTIGMKMAWQASLNFARADQYITVPGDAHLRWRHIEAVQRLLKERGVKQYKQFKRPPVVRCIEDGNVVWRTVRIVVPDSHRYERNHLADNDPRVIRCRVADIWHDDSFAKVVERKLEKGYQAWLKTLDEVPPEHGTELIDTYVDTVLTGIRKYREQIKAVEATL